MSLDFDSARLTNPFLTPSHEEWRKQLRRFIDKEIMPYAEEWDEAGKIPDSLWPKAAEVGIFAVGYPEAYGGLSEGLDIWYGHRCWRSYCCAVCSRHFFTQRIKIC